MHILREKVAFQGHLNHLIKIQDFYKSDKDYSAGFKERCVNPNGMFRDSQSG